MIDHVIALVESVSAAPGRLDKHINCEKPIAVDSKTALELHELCKKGGVKKRRRAGQALDYLKAIAAPYQHLGISFLPLGGINASNMSSYLLHSLVVASGGSWLAPREAIREGRWDHITSLVKTAVETIKSLRNK